MYGIQLLQLDQFTYSFSTCSLPLQLLFFSLLIIIFIVITQGTRPIFAYPTPYAKFFRL